MVTKYEVNRQLLEMGAADVVGPSREFVDSLGQRLDAIASTQPEYASHLIPPRRSRPKRVIFAPAFAALVIVVGLIVFSIDNGSSAYALHDPFNVQVQLADGRLVDGTDGLKVSRGATVVVGAGGSVRIRDRVYREGDVIVIGEDGPGVTDRLDVAAPSTRAEPAPTTRVERPATTEEPAATRPEPTVSPTVEPAPVTRIEVPETTRAPKTTVPTTTRTVVSMEIAAQHIELSSQVALSWTAVEGAAKYVVVRTVAVGGAIPAEPVYPPVAPSKVVAQTTARVHNDVAELVEGVLITAARYRVVALDASAKVIGSSRAVQVDLPR
ncbi:MAG TPA: hypothetical protein VM282_04100 [Acidimicrobiales bacterium]|nr:hypothetical protein [Acidimicrobiales bacterium]